MPRCARHTPKSESGAFGLVLYGWNMPLEIPGMDHHAAVKSLEYTALFLRKPREGYGENEKSGENRCDFFH